MAKKQKKQKAGIQKRKQAKVNARKKSVKKRVQAQAPAQKQMSMGKLKKILKELPTLVFEPEVLELSFSPEQIKAAQETSEVVPDQIDSAAGSEFMEKVKAALKEVEIRYAKAANSNKVMLVQTMGYFMDQPGSPACMNQVVVGLFYKSQMELAGEEVTEESLSAALQEYDKTWESQLAEKAESITNAAQGAPAPAQAADEEPMEVGAFAGLLSELSSYLESQDLDEEVLERAQEDAEALFEDYCEEKEISTLEELSPKKIQMFLTGWFVRNMNPTKKDMEGMLTSMEILFKFLQDTAKVSSDVATELATIISDKDVYLKDLT